jgi:uncharacterized protein (TIGR02444 family)
LWDYAVALYGQPDVAEACLELQDSTDADVNLLLLACWIGAEGIEADPATLDRLKAIATDWQATILKPLRQTRRMLKPMLATLPASLREPVSVTRKRIAGVELEAERAELLLLENALATVPRTAAPNASLAVGALRHFVTHPAITDEGLTTLLRHAFKEEEGLQPLRLRPGS